MESTYNIYWRCVVHEALLTHWDASWWQTYPLSVSKIAHNILFSHFKLYNSYWHGRDRNQHDSVAWRVHCSQVGYGSPSKLELRRSDTIYKGLFFPIPSLTSRPFKFRRIAYVWQDALFVQWCLCWTLHVMTTTRWRWRVTTLKSSRFHRKTTAQTQGRNCPNEGSPLVFQWGKVCSLTLVNYQLMLTFPKRPARCSSCPNH